MKHSISALLTGAEASASDEAQPTESKAKRTTRRPS
jgi:hypothetical protein